ncbi:30S ribosomal protein S20 [Archangium primigenium]|uniref:30S ribosomal protein S20 n=1 Tax=Melittangium TaxID=44 RepID=UPI00195A1129|nr:30S ribosomal protein S20 [Archangium primigenium]MBM7117564.1 30S ribosomal protein S20 [Archangium primigenium]
MANTKSAEKRNRQAQKRRARNINVRTTVKDAVKTLRDTLTTDTAKAPEAFKAAASRLNKAASKGVVHKRAASRRISRLAKAVNRAKAAATAK